MVAPWVMRVIAELHMLDGGAIQAFNAIYEAGIFSEGNCDGVVMRRGKVRFFSRLPSSLPFIEESVSL